MTTDASAVEELYGYGSFGFEERRDAGGVWEGDRYIGAVVNYESTLELQAFVVPDEGSSQSFGQKTHYSLNLHRSFLTTLRPFFNLGMGYANHEIEPFHVNFDVGLELHIKRLALRAFHKTQNHFWGVRPYGDAIFLFGLGLRLN